ncbi:MAG: hypothetical protein JXQ65_02340 [Candidatus Marinimicrobia bacterium]|nr:hypothetical protein [Candidatus Neomarinimicrobiota bacterium]
MIIKLFTKGILVLWALSFLTHCHITPKPNWERVINWHLEQYPASTPQDIYKLVYQGVLGPFHLHSSRQKMTDYLRKEMEQIEADPSIPTVEIISPDKKYIRINLKKYKAQNGSIDELGRLLFESCQPEDISRLILVLEEIDRLIHSGKILLDSREWQGYYKKIKQNNYFTPHHSDIYRRSYTPAYRVIAKKLWKE